MLAVLVAGLVLLNAVQALANPSWPNQITVDAELSGSLGAGAVKSVAITYDYTNSRERFDFEDAGGQILFSLIVLSSKGAEYFDVPGSGGVSASCVEMPFSGPLQGAFDWTDPSTSTTNGSGVTIADDPGAALVHENAIFDILDVLGASSTAGPLEATSSSSPSVGPVATVTAGEPDGGAVLTFVNYTATVNAGEFTVPPECPSVPTPSPVVQAAPLSGAVSFGTPFAAVLEAGAFSQLPGSFVATSATVPAGAGYGGKLSMTGDAGPFTYVEGGGDITDIAVDSTGAVTASESLAPGSYTVSGYAYNTADDAGTWTFTLTVNPGGLTQSSPASASVAGGAGYAGQLAVSGAQGGVLFSETGGDTSDVTVSSAGAITAAPSLAPGTYRVSGTDSDGAADTGTWAFALTVGAGKATLVQGAPTSDIDFDAATYVTQLTVADPPGGSGAVTFQATGGDTTDFTVASDGKISFASPSPGRNQFYTVSGTDADGANTGTWSYTLFLSALTPGSGLPQGPTSAPATLDSDVQGNLSAPGTLPAGTYTVTGLDADGIGDTGTFGYTLTVEPATTSTALAANPAGPAAGQQVTYTATVSPAPNGGFVAFSEAGSPIAPGCGSVPVGAGGTATCAVSYTSAGSHTVDATYQGDRDDSSSGAMTTVTVSAPSMSTGPTGTSGPGAVTGTTGPTAGGGSTVPAGPTGSTAPTHPGCPAAGGRFSNDGIGKLRLGMTQRQAERAYRRSSRRGFKYKQFFCLSPEGIRVGYASPRLLRVLGTALRAGLSGRIVWLSTSNRRYAAHGIRAGAAERSALRRLPHGTLLRVGRNDWYLAPADGATATLKIRDHVVQEVGIASLAATATRSDRRAFVKSFY